MSILDHKIFHLQGLTGPDVQFGHLHQSNPILLALLDNSNKY